jgi:hypothetical protein
MAGSDYQNISDAVITEIIARKEAFKAKLREELKAELTERFSIQAGNTPDYEERRIVSSVAGDVAHAGIAGLLPLDQFQIQTAKQKWLAEMEEGQAVKQPDSISKSTLHLLESPLRRRLARIVLDFSTKSTIEICRKMAEAEANDPEYDPQLLSPRWGKCSTWAETLKVYKGHRRGQAKKQWNSIKTGISKLL